MTVTLSSRTPGKPVHLASHPGRVNGRENPSRPAQVRGPPRHHWSWTAVGRSSGLLWSPRDTGPALRCQSRLHASGRRRHGELSRVDGVAPEAWVNRHPVLVGASRAERGSETGLTQEAGKAPTELHPCGPRDGTLLRGLSRASWAEPAAWLDPHTDGACTSGWNPT